MDDSSKLRCTSQLLSDDETRATILFVGLTLPFTSMVSQHLPSMAPPSKALIAHLLPTASLHSMSSQNDLPNHRIEEPTSISQSPSNLDLSVLTHDAPRTSRQSNYRDSVSFASDDQSEYYISENSQVLYMANSSKSPRKLRGSLSSIGNQATRRMDGPSDTEVDAEECSASERIAWNIIDREIFEWQYVCRTGRPYWWSPESKYSRLKKLPARLSNEPPPQSWMREIDDQPRQLYSKQRRAISEGCLGSEVCGEDLARLVAIQLLSSCFTLPPDQNGLPSPDFNSYKLNGPQNSPDPRLISSLRMHTHFRFSPSFGHQARNTSPVQLWSGSYDGPSPGSSPPYAATGFQTPVIGTSGSPSRRRREHRPLNVTEGSANGCWLDDRSDEYLKMDSMSNRDPTASASAWYHQRGIEDKNARPMILQCIPSQFYGRTEWIGHVKIDGNMRESYRGVQSCSRSRSPTTNYRLRPVLRSEPHHVFVQPVKELVVKRWKTFRRRFGASLNSTLPTEAGDFVSDGSSPAQSGASSPAMSSDARARRRRTQERGDIHSSIESTPHYNSPASGYEIPNNSGYRKPFWMDSANPTPTFELADPLAATANLVLAETEKFSGLSSSTSPKSSKSPDCSIRCETPLALLATTQCIAEVQSLPQLTPSYSSSQSYMKRIRKQQNRGSMLSEMHTPEDLAEDFEGGEVDKKPENGSVLSVARSAPASPSEKAESEIDLMIRSGASESIGNLSPVGAFSSRRMTISSESRSSLRLSKTSTSGTQVFTPNEDGVEIDGLPAGPSKERWARRGKRRERTYL